MPFVKSADADANAKTVTVAFDDTAGSLDAVIKALNEAGYVVGTPELKK